MMTLVVLAGCGGRSQAAARPEDPFAGVPVAPLPIASLAGSSALLLAVGGVVVGDSANPLPELAARRLELLDAANAAIDTALRRDAHEVTWVGLPEQRRAMRRSPTLGVDPDRLPTAFLAGPHVERVPDPLWSSIRALQAVTGARMAIVPAVARIVGRPGALRAEVVFVAVDPREGQVLWRGRVVGLTSATAEAAFASAAGTAVQGLLH